ncbi:hypothetical protein [Rhodococcus sp. YH1]|uniref:hypothetical protein n=1 Tax=Rhodococcus sp. YH1 TaxID=89066 RepID=UPI00192E475F|nr:hypothetical protein [Rhodococcus sp. YH1]NCL78798.1 hypothetical protein [Rhodococcus sp. YH1]
MKNTRLPLWMIPGVEFTRGGLASRKFPMRDGDGHPNGDAVDNDDEAGTDGVGDEDQDSDVDVDTDTGEDDDENPDGADQLGDKGKKALDAMKAKWQAEKAKRVAAESRVAELETGDDENAQAQRQADAAALAKANARIVKAEVRAAAAGKLSDPADAFRFLDLDDFEVDDDGDVDQDEIAAAITDLLERKPYLAASSSDGTQRASKSPKPDRSQGAGGKGKATPQQDFESAIGRLLS